MTVLFAEPITQQRALELLEEQVALKGEDYRPTTGSCVNVEPVVAEEDGGWVPSCIVGYALCSLGIEPRAFVETGLVDAGVHLLAYEGAIQFESTDAEAVWSIAQDVQDTGGTWGEALAAAKRVAFGEEEYGDIYASYDPDR